MNQVVSRDDRHPETVFLPLIVLWHEVKLVASSLALCVEET